MNREEATDQANIRDYYAEIATALVTGDLGADHTTMTLTGGITATYAGGTNSYTVTVTAPKVNQTISNWQSGAFTVAGVSVAENADMKAKPVITFTFQEPSTGNAYLSSIAFSAAP